MLNVTGEMSENLGLYELLPSGVLLMTSLLEAPAPAIHHGHGDGVSVHVPTDIAPPPARDYSPEELRAMVWKCRLHKSSPESIQSLLQKLPEECIKEMVERFRERQVAGASKSAPSRSYFIIKRDAFQTHKTKAVQQFVD